MISCKYTNLFKAVLELFMPVLFSFSIYTYHELTSFFLYAVEGKSIIFLLMMLHILPVLHLDTINLYICMVE